jgi:hypothetical protein
MSSTTSPRREEKNSEKAMIDIIPRSFPPVFHTARCKKILIIQYINIILPKLTLLCWLIKPIKLQKALFY